MTTTLKLYFSKAFPVTDEDRPDEPQVDFVDRSQKLPTECRCCGFPLRLVDKKTFAKGMVLANHEITRFTYHCGNDACDKFVASLTDYALQKYPLNTLLPDLVEGPTNPGDSP